MMRCDWCGGPHGTDPGNGVFQCKKCTEESPKTIIRKVFICAHCESIYVDNPERQCGCKEGSGEDFIQGELIYQIKRKEKL